MMTSIRIHNDPMAERLSKFYGAEALTMGRDIFLSSSKSDLSTSRGMALLVHEITHVLQEVDRHSGEGLMKARWSSHDYHRMRRSPLKFAEEDVMLIGLALDRRRQQMAGDMGKN